ncbi:relaxase/mobilization nuclease domain-containing protein [bacterium]|nr:relaxase/mobilization nuclease domain-containing protein [bacterium]
MVIVIHQAANTGNALCYNEKKVNEGAATFFHSRNTKSVNPFMYDEKHRLKNLLDIEKMNPRTKNKCLHISFNPSTEDYLKLGDNHIRQEVDNMMEYMGYTSQPYFVYKHKDLERVHFHVVSTRIDRQTGKKIKDNYERQKMQRFVKNLEEKYQLNHKDAKQQPEFRFSPRSRNIKQNLENLFKHLNGLEEITSMKMYDEALKIFNVEIKKSGRGHIVLVTDGEGIPIRYPIWLSKFKERPKFYQTTKQINEQTQIADKQFSNPVIDKFQLGQLARDLNRLVERNTYPESKLKQRLKMRKKGKKYR